MKKIVILTFTIILLLVCLVIGACSKSPTPQPQPQPQATNKIPDLSGVIFNGATYQYDGTPKSLYVTGLPAGIVAQYNGNDVADAGVHLVTAKLYYDGKLVKNLSAELVIKKAVYRAAYGIALFKVVLDVSNISPAIITAEALILLA